MTTYFRLKGPSTASITKTLKQDIIQCTVCLLCGIPYDLKKNIYIQLHKKCWTGNVLAGDCAQLVYKNIK